MTTSLSFPAFPEDSAAPRKLQALLAGKGPRLIKLSWNEVHAGGPEGLKQLEAFVAPTDLGYSHDPFKSEWRLWRPTTGNLFDGVAAHG